MSHRRFGAALAAAAITMSAFAPMAMAQSDPVPPPAGPVQEDARNAYNEQGNYLGEIADVTNADVDQLLDNPNATGSLTINKYEGAPLGANETLADREALAGVEFTLYRINNLSPTKLVDWQTFASLSMDTFNKEENATLEGSQVTDADGVAKWDNLPMGFFYVEETPAPGRTQVNPFFIAVPLTAQDGDNAGTTWNFHPEVHPKNQTATVTKEVSDSFAKSGDTIAYAMSGSIPIPSNDGEELEHVAFTDVSPENISLKTETAVLTLGYTDVDGVFTELMSFSGDNLVKDVTADDTGDVFSVALSTDERAQVAPYLNTGQLLAQLKVDATVGEMDEAAFNSTVVQKNTVYFFTSLTGGDPLNPTDDDPNDDVDSHFGSVRLFKHEYDPDNATVYGIQPMNTYKALEGAEFQLYRCENVPEGYYQPRDETSLIDGPLMVSGEDRWTTDENGYISITGLQVDDYRNGGTADDAFDYCFVETKAPEGYELLPHPIPFDISVSFGHQNLEVANVKENGGQTTPLTGEAGVGILLGIGALLAGGAAYGINRKKKAAADADTATA